MRMACSRLLSGGDFAHSLLYRFVSRTFGPHKLRNSFARPIFSPLACMFTRVMGIVFQSFSPTNKLELVLVCPTLHNLRPLPPPLPQLLPLRPRTRLRSIRARRRCLRPSRRTSRWASSSSSLRPFLARRPWCQRVSTLSSTRAPVSSCCTVCARRRSRRLLSTRSALVKSCTFGRLSSRFRCSRWAAASRSCRASMRCRLLLLARLSTATCS